MMKRPYLIPLFLAAGALGAGALPALAAQAASVTSHNWSGYVAQGAGFTQAEGSWTVPQIAGAAGAGDAEWVGIGGMQGSDLIQAGTRGLESAAGASYEAWYELLPAAAVALPMTVSPGDHMRAVIEKVAPDSWRITLDDLTSGAGFSTTLAYHSSESSAEWIVEAPQRAGADIPLDTFTPISWQGASATEDGSEKTPAALGATRVFLVGAEGAPRADPSLLSQGGAFSVARS